MKFHSYIRFSGRSIRSMQAPSSSVGDTAQTACSHDGAASP